MKPCCDLPAKRNTAAQRYELENSDGILSFARSMTLTTNPAPIAPLQTKSLRSVFETSASSSFLGMSTLAATPACSENSATLPTPSSNGSSNAGCICSVDTLRPDRDAVRDRRTQQSSRHDSSSHPWRNLDIPTTPSPVIPDRAFTELRSGIKSLRFRFTHRGVQHTPRREKACGSDYSTTTNLNTMPSAVTAHYPFHPLHHCCLYVVKGFAAQPRAAGLQCTGDNQGIVESVAIAPWVTSNGAAQSRSE